MPSSERAGKISVKLCKARSTKSIACVKAQFRTVDSVIGNICRKVRSVWDILTEFLGVRRLCWVLRINRAYTAVIMWKITCGVVVWWPTVLKVWNGAIEITVGEVLNIHWDCPFFRYDDVCKIYMHVWGYPFRNSHKRPSIHVVLAVYIDICFVVGSKYLCGRDLYAICTMFSLGLPTVQEPISNNGIVHYTKKRKFTTEAGRYISGSRT